MGACYTMQVIAKFNKENDEKFVNELAKNLKYFPYYNRS